jgi:hypothetical protein
MGASNSWRKVGRGRREGKEGSGNRLRFKQQMKIKNNIT